MEKVKVTKNPKANFETKKLSLLVLIVNQGVGDVYIEQLYSLESNLQLKILGNGTVSKEIQNLLGLNEVGKDIIFAVMREEKLDEAFEYIETRFKLSKKHRGIAFSVKINSLVGVSVYKLLSNTLKLKPNGGKKDGK